ncbi:MAG TPA: glycoside hydrolase family 16 protein [Candidatus Saccharimonadales bacterium]|nr:glycoside hydrolase family 16 protein [Candidatus Saccharimonadales bacterium]
MSRGGKSHKISQRNHAAKRSVRISKNHHVIIIAVILIVAVLGYLTLHNSRAATFAVASETDSGTVAGNASVTTDSTASGGKAVKFGGTSSSTTAPPIPTAVPSGFTRAFTADFNTTAALGSFDSVYGSQFGEYSGCCSTNGITQYSSAKVLYAQNGSMFYKLHSEGSTSYAAAPQAWNYGSFTYGQVGMSVRLVSSNGPGYKIAFLLWPETNQWTNEVDFPEVDPDFTAPIRAVSLNTTTAGGSHTFCGPLDTGYHLNDNKYHTFLLTWAPGSMNASIDGKVVETFPSSCIPSQPMRLSLQAEGWIGQGSIPTSTTDVLEVPWVYINTRN